MRVLLSHPHAATFAVDAANALAAHNQLAAFVTGVAGGEGSVAARILVAVGKRRPTALNRVLHRLPPAAVHSLGAVELVVRVVARAVRASAGGTYDALFTCHDAATAAMPWPRDADTVYAYEDAALLTFERARRQGKRCIWDLPIPHHATLARMWHQEFLRWPGAMGAVPHAEPAWKVRRKARELELADTVSVASNFTRESLMEQGCTKPITVSPYAFPVDGFPLRARPPEGPFTVLAVGSHDLRKGTPYLLEAFRRAALPDAKLVLVGPMRLTPSFLAPYRGSFLHVPHVSRANLPETYAAADLLAFPTLGDGFGLVIQEAMCTGIPVLTTPCGGGPECLTHGEHGWIVPPRNVDVLVETLRWAHAHRDAVTQMGLAARTRALQGGPAAAGRHFVQQLAHT